MAENEHKPAADEQQPELPKITLQLKDQLPDGSYTSKVLSKMFNMLVDLDLVENTPNAIKKWGFLPKISIFGNDIVKMMEEFKSDKEEKEVIEAIDAAFEKINEFYRNSQFRYKEAMRLLTRQQLRNENIFQIIVLYFFAINDIDPKDKEPLSAEQKEDLFFIAQEMDDFYTNTQEETNQEKYLNDDFTDIPKEYPEAREFFAYFPLVIYFMRYQGIADLALSEEKAAEQQPEPKTEPNIIWAEAHGTETITSEAHISANISVQAAFTETITGTAHGEAVTQPQPLQLELPFLPPIAPKYYIMPNNALMNDIEKKERINYGAYDLDVFGAKSDITTYIAISYEPDPDSGIAIKGPDRISAYERTVTNAIVSLWEAALKDGQTKPIISPEMIYRAMPGGSDRLSRGQKSAIVKAINKFRILHIEIDATEEMRKRKVIGPKDKFTLDSNYLLTTHAEYKAQNGRTVHAYRIEAEPIILTYSKAAKQLLSIPAKYLDIRQVKAGKITDKPIRMSEDRQAIANYLLWRIAIMKQDAKNKKPTQSHNILFVEVFKIAGLANLTRDQKLDLRKFCFGVLDYQTAAGNISGYKKLKEGQEIAKIEILL